MSRCKHPMKYQNEIIAPWTGGTRAGWWCTRCGSIKRHESIVMEGSKVTMNLRWRWHSPLTQRKPRV